MDEENPVNYKSQDIKKPDLEFNVQEKKSVTFKSGLNAFWHKKILESPPLKGKRKRITLPAAALIIAAAITLPIILPWLSGSESAPPQSESMTEEERRQWTSEISNTVNNLDSGADEDVKNAVIDSLDSQLAAATTDEDRLFLIGAKANALNRFGQHLDAVATLEAVVSELEAKRNWPKLIEIYEYISSSHRQAGDKAAALVYLIKVLGAYDMATSDPNYPFPLSDRGYYEAQLKLLEDEL